MNNPELLTVYDFSKKIHLGNKGDGGYVIADIDTVYDCYISAGISNEESFSRDFINKYNMTKDNSFAFDGTIESYPTEFTENITFTKKNIGSLDDDNTTNLKVILNSYSNVFVKMDIEGGEYQWIECLNIQELSNIGQLTIELHGITGDGWNTVYENKVKCLEKLNISHYIIHAHGNNFAPVHNNIPDVIELTYLNKRFFDQAPSLNDKLMPMSLEGLDYPNLSNVPDINLSFPPFTKQVLTVFKKVVVIGSSTENTKVLKSVVKDNNKHYRVILGDNNTNDKFDFQLIDRDLVVRRIDREEGWGLNHTAIVYLIGEDENHKDIIRDFAEFPLTYRRIVNIGKSETPGKIIDISDNNIVIQVALCRNETPDRFSFKIIDKSLLVTRRDKDEGWNHNHFVYIYKSNRHMNDFELDNICDKNLTELDIDTPVFYKKKVNLGKSDKYVKKIDISDVLDQETHKLVICAHKFGDKFNCKLENSKLTVTRTDKEDGWGYDHSLLIYN